MYKHRKTAFLRYIVPGGGKERSDAPPAPPARKALPDSHRHRCLSLAPYLPAYPWPSAAIFYPDNPLHADACTDQDRSNVASSSPTPAHHSRRHTQHRRQPRHPAPSSQLYFAFSAACLKACLNLYHPQLIKFSLLPPPLKLLYHNAV